MSAQTATADDLHRAVRHARLRWVGIPMFWVGAAGLVLALLAWVSGRVGFGAVGLYMAATGLSLGSFGVNNDTALALAQRAPREELPAALREELATDLRAHPAQVSGLVPSPVVAQGVLLVALVLHGLAATVLARAL